MSLLVKTIKTRGNERKYKRIFVASTTSVTYSDNIILFLLLVTFSSSSYHCFMIHGFWFRYILLGEKSPSCIKYPHHKENNIVTVGYRGSWRNKDSFVFPLISSCFDCFNKQRHYLRWNCDEIFTSGLQKSNIVS